MKGNTSQIRINRKKHITNFLRFINIQPTFQEQKRRKKNVTRPFPHQQTIPKYLKNPQFSKT